MDAAFLTTSAFWDDPQPWVFGEITGLPELPGHVFFATSGSSGPPKWIALSKPALQISAAAVNAHLGVHSGSCWGLALPLHHVGGFGVAARAFQANCHFHAFLHRWNAREFRDWLTQFSVTHSSLVPTQVHDLVKSQLTAPSSLVAVVVGGGHLDPLTGQAARDLGWPILASYGMTEAASQIATQTLDSLHQPYRAAPLPVLPIWQTQLTTDGRLKLAGPALFTGQFIDHQWHPRENPWHTTHDCVRLEHGHLHPLSRADAAVKILGELVDPESVEHELCSLSHGRLALGSFAVIALPDARSGHLLQPIFDHSVEPQLIDEILASYQVQAPGFRRLQPPARLEHLPRSPLGKIRRAELEAQYLGSKAPFPPALNPDA